MQDNGQMSRQLMKKGTVSRRAAKRKNDMCHVQVDGKGGRRKDCDSGPVVWELETHVASRRRRNGIGKLIN